MATAAKREFFQVGTNEKFNTSDLNIDVDYSGLAPDIHYGGFALGRKFSVKKPVPISCSSKSFSYEILVASLSELVATADVANELAAMAKKDFQAFETTMEIKTKRFVLVNPIHELDCLDLKLSSYTSMPGSQNNLIVDCNECFISSRKVKDFDVFVVKKWGALLVSDRVKTLFSIYGEKCALVFNNVRQAD